MAKCVLIKLLYMWRLALGS